MQIIFDENQLKTADVSSINHIIYHLKCRYHEIFT